MARMTAQDIVDEVRLHLGGETTETVSDNQILRWVNRSYIDLASNYRFNELEASTSVTTVDGTAEYAIPSTGSTDILTVISVTDDTNNLTLQPWNRRQYDLAVQGDAANVTGTPVFWFISGVGDNSDTPPKTVQRFTFYPTPGGAYTINVVYRKKPAELVLTPSATSSVLLEPWDEALALLAVARGWRALGDDDKSYKAKLSANDASKIAEASSFIASAVPVRFGSVVGNALMDT